MLERIEEQSKGGGRGALNIKITPNHLPLFWRRGAEHSVNFHETARESEVKTPST